ncbi:MAG: hypothetical protein EA364_12920 [Balneolaceae bacterium]|nr:MAG: hypothetical protein EA364_12920 [Balneolaceae bacterium]
MKPNHKTIKISVTVLISALTGITILFIHHLAAGLPVPEPGQYYYSKLAAGNYTWITATLFLIAAVIIKHFNNGNPFAIGFGMILIFPLISVAEATVYPGSHNLIPIEFAIHILWAIPSLAGAYGYQLLRKVSPAPEMP